MGVTLQLDETALEWLAKEGADPEYGARPLRRAIQHFVENPLSKRILAGEFVEGDHVRVELGDEGLKFTAVDANNLEQDEQETVINDQSTVESEVASVGD